MRRILLTVATISVALAVYVRLHADVAATPEYEFTIVERLGKANQSAPNADGSAVTKTFFRRKDGVAGYMIRDARNGTAATTVQYLNPMQRAKIVVLVEKKMKTTYPVPPQQAQLWESPPGVADCSEAHADSKKVGESQLFGIAVQKLQTENATESLEMYAAPSLGCAILQADHRWKDASGAFSSWTNDDLISLRIGPPNPAYFDLDNGSEEVPPSEARMAIRALLFPNEPSCPQCYLNGNSRADARYYKMRDQAQKGWPSVSKIYDHK